LPSASVAAAFLVSLLLPAEFRFADNRVACDAGVFLQGLLLGAKLLPLGLKIFFNRLPPA
jgi:hypothetical protein